MKLVNKFVFVTALYDINRKDRKFEFYINNLKKLLNFKVPIIIFCNSETHNKLKKIKRNHFTKFIIKEFRELYFFKNHYTQIKEILESKKFVENVKDYGARIETTSAEYNIVNYSKFFFLENAKELLHSDYYIWVDAGIPRFFKKIPEDVWPDFSKFKNKIIVQTFRNKEINEKFGKEFSNVIDNIEMEKEFKLSRYLIIGTTFVVPKNYVSWLKEKILFYYKKMVSYGFINNEQVALEFVVKDYPKYFDIKINNSEKWYNFDKYI